MKFAIAAIALIVASAPLCAEEPTAPPPRSDQPSAPPIQTEGKPSEAELAAAHEAELRGAEMYRYDQAAWHATDRFRADLAAAGIESSSMPERGVRGYLVEPADGTALAVTFYGEDAQGRWAYARYRYDDGPISGEGLLPDGSRQPISPLANRMADARGRAITEAMKPGHDLCSDSPANTLVLPAAGGGLSVYLLTSTRESKVYPAGGHYRFDFSPAGDLVGERRFMKSCFPLNFGERDGKRPEMVFLTHLLDPQPTEIHAFVSRNIPLPLAIGAVSSREIWVAYRGKVQFVRTMDDVK